MSSEAVVVHGPERGGTLASVRRWAAMLVLPASILPVLFLGPTLLRAPHKLWREAGAELQRLEESGRAHGVSPAVHLAPGRRLPRSGSPRATGRAAGSDAGSHSRLTRGASGPHRARPSSEGRKPR